MSSPLRSDLSWLSAPQQTEGFKKRWFTLDDRRLMYFKDRLVGAEPNALQNRPDESVLMTSVCSRMRTRGGRFSSGVRKAATPPSPAFPRTVRAPTGSLGSPLWPRIASSCLPARRNGTRKTGSLPFRPLSTDPCCLRIMQVCYSRLPIFYSCAPKNKGFWHIFFAVEAFFKHKPWAARR